MKLSDLKPSLTTGIFRIGGPVDRASTGILITVGVCSLISLSLNLAFLAFPANS